MHLMTTEWADALHARGLTPHRLAALREPARPRLLIVMDPGFHLGREGAWGLGRLLDVLREGAPLDLAPRVRLASRGAPPEPVHDAQGRPWPVDAHFDFAAPSSGVDLGRTDQVWLFASPQGEPLREDEVETLRRFMDAGGGVLATGHGGGLPLWRSLPRVRQMAERVAEGPSPARPARGEASAVGSGPARTPMQEVWQEHPHPLMVFEARALGLTDAAAETLHTTVDLLPRPLAPLHATRPAAGAGQALREAEWPAWATVPAFGEAWGGSSAEVVARVAVPLGCNPRDAAPVIQAYDGHQTVQQRGARAGRIVFDATALHLLEVEPRGLDTRGHASPRAWSSAGEGRRARSKSTAFLLNVLHWLQPAPRAAEACWWDLVCLSAHPLVTQRLALMDDLPREARVTATVGLGERLADAWQAWRGHYVNDWLPTVAATGADAMVGLAHRMGPAAADAAPHRCRSAAALGAALLWMNARPEAGGRTPPPPDLASFSARTREAWLDAVHTGLAALVASESEAPARQARAAGFTRGRPSPQDGPLWQVWRRELRRWVQGLASGTPETAES